jgi:hypothetical protein
VVVRSVVTDPSIEKAIQDAVANQKRLEAMTVQTEIAKKEAEVRVTEAQGIAEANRIIAGSLTREYLQHEANQALLEFARTGNTNTVVLPANMSGNLAPHHRAAQPRREAGAEAGRPWDPRQACDAVAAGALESQSAGSGKDGAGQRSPRAMRTCTAASRASRCRAAAPELGIVARR